MPTQTIQNNQTTQNNQTSNNQTINQPSTNKPQWLFDNQPYNHSRKHIGFVYLIINHTTGKFYIGKKSFTPKWQGYTGSSTTLNTHIKQGHLITKHIIHLCTTKSELNFIELFLQISTNAINDPKYYNEYIQAKIKSSRQLQSIDLKKIIETFRRTVTNP